MIKETILPDTAKAEDSLKMTFQIKIFLHSKMEKGAEKI